MQGGLFDRSNLLCLQRSGVTVAQQLAVRGLLARLEKKEESAPSPELARAAGCGEITARDRSVSPIALAGSGSESPVPYSLSSPPAFGRGDDARFDSLRLTCDAAEDDDVDGHDGGAKFCDEEELSEDDLTQRFAESLHLGNAGRGRGRGAPTEEEKEKEEQEEHFNTLALVRHTKKSSKPTTAFASKRQHEQVAAWLERAHNTTIKGQECSSPCSVVLYSDRSRSRIVTTVLQHASNAIAEQAGQSGLLLALRAQVQPGGGRGILIVASKTQVEVWASLLRSLAHIRLLCYTDALAKRRLLGSKRLRNFDAIVTTFDVLKVKEIAMPEDELELNREEGEGGGEEAAQSGEWLTGRARADAANIVEISQLHLFHYATLIVDGHECGGGIKANSMRGKAILRVSADYKLGLVDDNGQESATGPYSMPAVKVMRELLGGCRLPVASITLDARL